MPHVSYHNIRHTPHYGLSHARQRREPSASAPEGFHRTFRRAGYRREMPLVASREARCATHTADNANAQRRAGGWPAALAILMVANLAAPAAGALPRRNLIAEAHDDAYSLPQLPPVALREVPAMPSSSTTVPPDDVDIRPVEPHRLRTDYTLMDMLRIVAASRSPFEKFGESLSDAYEVFIGEAPATETRQNIRRSGKIIDFSTGLMPQVRMSRLPGDISHVAVEQIEGRAPIASDVATLMQALDPRTWRADVNAESVVAPAASEKQQTWGETPLAALLDRLAVDGRRESDDAPPGLEGANGAARDEADPPAQRAPEYVPDSAPDSAPDSPSEGADGSMPRERADEALPAEPVAVLPSIPQHAASSHRIAGEREHLAGYEQPISAERLSLDPHSQMFQMDGHYYLAGENGFYRLGREMQENVWLIDAPRHSRAQVPVTFDPQTREWLADAPLRLCGGGCNQSKRIPESDSIVDGWPAIASAISHLPDLDTQDAIQAAFGNLSSLRLLRGNRADLRATRDYSIVGHRAALRKAMRNIDREAPLLQQQQQVAAATAMYYSDNPQAEAFCQENAEILFHLLLESGVPEERIRMITFQPQHRPAHVMVLYTESETFIDMLHVATPQPMIHGRPDGIGDRMFSRAVFLTRDTTLLLDPWSRTKATGFGGTFTERDVQQRLNRILAALGHRDGHPFVVSITRPFGTHTPGSRMRSTSSSGSAGSPVSLGSESNANVFDPPSPPDQDMPSSSDDAPEDAL
ncbi:hypothetical protein PCA20602_01824 [Pandoraea capi]|uniref:Uncharacterized protein n=1 Tax=Pandoraea capi TaxID=2508286 RepID=A0ABY6VVS3_9BURK|nr:hypothetical protein [Pandoraea capi]VVD94730.1 hypothetical protein PCA20602_01824 [Pandoraea capi]